MIVIEMFELPANALLHKSWILEMTRCIQLFTDSWHGLSMGERKGVHWIWRGKASKRDVMKCQKARVCVPWENKGSHFDVGMIQSGLPHSTICINKIRDEGRDVRKTFTFRFTACYTLQICFKPEIYELYTLTYWSKHHVSVCELLKTHSPRDRGYVIENITRSGRFM